MNKPYEGQAHHLNKAAMTLVRLLNDIDFSTFDERTAADLTGEVHRLINRLEGAYQPRGTSGLYIPKAEHEAILNRALRGVTDRLRTATVKCESCPLGETRT